MILELAIGTSLLPAAYASLWVDQAPNHVRAYAIEHYATATALTIGAQTYRFPVTGPASGHKFTLLTTNAPTSGTLGVFPYTHELHHENFFCYKGRLQLWASKGNDTAAWATTALFPPTLRTPSGSSRLIQNSLESSPRANSNNCSITSPTRMSHIRVRHHMPLSICPATQAQRRRPTSRSWRPSTCTHNLHFRLLATWSTAPVRRDPAGTMAQTVYRPTPAHRILSLPTGDPSTSTTRRELTTSSKPG